MTAALDRIHAMAGTISRQRFHVRRAQIGAKWFAYLFPQAETAQKVSAFLKSGYTALFLWPVAIVNAGKFRRYLHRLESGHDDSYTSEDKMIRKTMTKVGDLVDRGSEAIIWTDSLLFGVLSDGTVSTLSFTGCFASLMAAATRLATVSIRLYNDPSSLRWKMRWLRDFCLFGLSFLATLAMVKKQADLALVLLLFQTALTLVEYIRHRQRHAPTAQPA